MKRGFFACDPGGSTGLAWAVVDLKEGIASREHHGSKTVKGGEQLQIILISQYWRTFYKRCVEDYGLGPEDVEFVCEDFKPRPDKGHTEEGIMPVRLIWGVTGYRLGQYHEYDRNHWGPAYCPDMIMQLASLAATHVTDDRLRRMGLWIRGREHERSAWRHLAYRVAKLRQLYANREQ